MSNVRKLTDEQVQMLIEDGTLSKAIDLAEKSKKEQEYDAVAKIATEILDSVNQAHCLPKEFVDKYKNLAMMMFFGHSIPNTVEEVYLYRNLIMGRYAELVRNMIHEVHYFIRKDIYTKYELFIEDFNIFFGESNLMNAIYNKLSDLNFMNQFVYSIDGIDNHIMGNLIQSIIERIAYKLSPVPYDRHVLYNELPKTNVDCKPINVPVVAYSYFDDVALLVDLIVLAAKTCLATMAHSGDNLPQGLSDQILPPLPFDMSMPLNDYEYNINPAQHIHNPENVEIRPRKLYTRILTDIEE